MRYFKRPDNNEYYPEDMSTPYCVEHLNGTKYYYSHDQIFHRENYPAIIYTDGHKRYYLNGEYYGTEYNYTDESWARFCKLKVFQ